MVVLDRTRLIGRLPLFFRAEIDLGRPATHFVPPAALLLQPDLDPGKRALRHSSSHREANLYRCTAMRAALQARLDPAETVTSPTRR